MPGIWATESLWIFCWDTDVFKAQAYNVFMFISFSEMCFFRNGIAFYYWDHLESKLSPQYPGVHYVTGCFPVELRHSVFPNGYCRSSEMNFQGSTPLVIQAGNSGNGYPTKKTLHQGNIQPHQSFLGAFFLRFPARWENFSSRRAIPLEVLCKCSALNSDLSRRKSGCQMFKKCVCIILYIYVHVKTQIYLIPDVYQKKHTVILRKIV